MTLQAVASQALLSMGFSRQEYWSGLSCPSLGDLPDPGIEPASLMSLALADKFFTTSTTWEAPSESSYCVTDTFYSPSVNDDFKKKPRG